MWAIFKCYISSFFIGLATELIVLSALSATLTSTVNPAIPIMNAGADLAELVGFDEMAASITIPTEVLFYSLLAFSSLMLLWKKGQSNGSKAAAMLEKKLEWEFAKKESKTDADVTTTIADENSIVYISVNDKAKNAEVKTHNYSSYQELCYSLNEISTQPVRTAKLSRNYKNTLINKFTHLTLQMRAGEITNIDQAISEILHDPRFKFTEQDRYDILNSISISTYFDLLNKVKSPISRTEQIKNYILEKIYNTATYLTVPGEILLSGFSLLIPLTKISKLPKIASIILSSFPGVLSSGMTFAILFDTKKIRTNLAFNDALNGKSSLFVKMSKQYLAILYAGIVSGIGSATVDLVIANSAIDALFSEEQKEHNLPKDLFTLLVYVMLAGIAYRKILGTIDQMDDTFNNASNIFYGATPKKSMFQYLRDFSVPIEKAIAAALATAVQMYGFFGSYAISAILALNTLICTAPQAMAVIRPAAKQHDADVLIANKIFFDLLSATIKKLILNPNQIETDEHKKVQKKFLKKFEDNLAYEIKTSKSEVASTFNFSFFNTPLKQPDQSTIILDDNNLSVNSESSAFVV